VGASAHPEAVLGKPSATLDRSTRIGGDIGGMAEEDMVSSSIGKAMVVVAIGLLAAACSKSSTPSTSASATQSAQPVTVRTANTSLGTFLVGPDGKTLYLFEADTSSRSTCSGACAQGWPPITTNGPPVAGSGVMQSLLSTSPRDDGTLQVVYNGHPLYNYSGDTKAGDTNGEGSKAFGAGWDVVSPAGNKIEEPGD
jgi:predicted lipoprotein with Yx(FWY)xxD motif